MHEEYYNCFDDISSIISCCKVSSIFDASGLDDVKKHAVQSLPGEWCFQTNKI